jgi:hypothetical protein
MTDPDSERAKSSDRASVLNFRDSLSRQKRKGRSEPGSLLSLFPLIVANAASQTSPESEEPRPVKAVFALARKLGAI